MRRYELKIQKYDTFCELCSEYHEYIDCPLCDGDILEIYEGKVAHCSDGHLFAIWNNKGKNVVMVECEYIWNAKFAKAKCDEESRTEHLADPHLWNDNLSCCEERCPLLAPSLAHFRESITM